MLIEQHDLAFVHVPKCGGVSVTHALIEALTGQRYQGSVSGIAKELRTKYALETPKQRHARASEYCTQRKFALVRNPYDRFYSAYKWTCRVGFYKKKGVTAKKFVKDTIQRFEDANNTAGDPAWFHTQPQTYFIDESCVYVVKLEDFFNGESNAKLNDYIGFDLPLIRKDNRSKHHVTKHDFFSHDIVDFVKEYYQEDFKKFEYKHD